MQGVDFIFSVIILVMSVVIHEVSHGYVANILGDPTARLAGRLTLNPLKHLDPFGSVLLPGMLIFLGLPAFGWARPVPYNPYNLQAGSWGPGIVGAAGPLSNLFIAFVFGMALRFGMFSLKAGTLIAGIVVTNLVLAVFNLIPVPPLDGSKVLFAFLPYRYQYVEEWMNRNQLVLVLVVIFMAGGFLSGIIPVLFELLTGISVR